MRPSIKQLILVLVLILTALFLTLTACTPTAGQTVPITVTRVLPTATVPRTLLTATPSTAETDLTWHSFPIPETTTLIAPLPGMVYKVGGDLWRVAADGQAVRLTGRANGTLSPDGRHFLYYDEDDFWVVETTEAAQPINLTAASEREHTRAQWWPGRPGAILLGHWKLSPTPGVFADYFLAEVSVDGSGYRLLDEDGCAIEDPTVLPDGQAIVYQRCDKIVINHLDGEPQPFTIGDFEVEFGVSLWSLSSPAWSPDGRAMTGMVAAFGGGYGYGGGNGEIEAESVAELVLGLFDIEAQTVRLLRFEPEFEPAKWSPDGRWFAVKDAAGGLRVFSADASQQYYLAEARSDFFWGMDDQLAFSVALPAPTTFYLFDVGSSAITQSIELPGVLVDWHP